MAPAPTSWSTGCATTSSSRTDGSVAGGRVGRDGLLRLVFARRGPATVLTEKRFTLPLQALRAVDLDGSGVATMTLLNPTGGLVGGDVVETSVTLRAGSHVCLTTAAASRVYRSAGPPAVQRFTAVLEGGAVLEYMPDHLIPSPGARLLQSTEIVLAPEATLIGLDAWAVGRVARGERWRFDSLDTTLTIGDARGLLLRERAMLTRASFGHQLAGAEDYSYVATLVAAAPARHDWNELARDLEGAVEKLQDRARVAATLLSRGGLIVRILCPSAPTLYEVVDAVWSATRLLLLGLGPLRLRKL